MTVSIARKISFNVLLRVAAHGAYADEALRGALGASVGREDAGLATELTFGVVRWQRLLDFLIDRHLAKANKALDDEVRITLRLGAYQLFFLQRVPARAAVHESVELVKAARKKSAAPLVNAVLRKLAKDAESKRPPSEIVAPLLPAALGVAERLAILHSHPTWLVERWVRAYGEARAETLLGANNRVPTLAGYIAAPEHREDVLTSLQKSGCSVEPGKLLRDAVILHGGNPTDSEIVRNGWLAIQDEASQCVAQVVAVAPENSVLDLCAAPGGKTLRLAMDAGPEGHVLAGDLHANRVRAMAERFAGAGLKNVETRTLDGMQPLAFEKKFERVLVDAPCSGTGTLARHPEIRWKIRAEDLTDLHARQVSLLRNAAACLASGGRLVYSTCSLEREENENVVAETLGALGEMFTVISARATVEKLLRDSLSVESVLASDGFFRTFPGEQDTDGFFAAVIVRT